MDTHTFKIGDRVKATGVWSHQGVGTVENLNDWWVIVRLDEDGVKRPFMEGELSHANTG